MQTYTDSTVSPGRFATASLGAPATHGVGARLRDTLAVGGDALLMIGVIFCIPFVMLAIGLPIAAFLRLLLWVAGI